MLIDNEALLSSSQDLSQTTGDYYSTYAYDMGSTTGDLGSGAPIYVVICVDAAFTSGGSATVTFNVIDEADSTLDSSSVIIVSTRAIAIATLTAGKVITIPVPAGLITQQFIGLRYDIGTATTTAGTVSAFVSLQPVLNP